MDNRELPDGVNTVRDPHHGGTSEFAYYKNHLWHRTSPLCRTWCHVKKVSFTPKRILAIATLLTISTYGETPVKTTTSTTAPIDCLPVWLLSSPNMDHPVFSENPDRVVGVNAALTYLGRKGHDVWKEYGGDCPMFVYLATT